MDKKIERAMARKTQNRTTPKIRGTARVPASQRRLPISFTLTVEQIEALDVLADKKRISRTELIRTIVTRYLTR